ncbi:MAG: exodeoxyribonuclease VII large subunit [candidate division Zixibacteria bacterium]|nr:exodeoxyribonuclease VII large subunit [candidate division Zixibacteria bacterium]
MWKGTGQRLGFDPSDGLRVRAFGQLTVYPPQGTYQLVVAQMLAAGIGPLEVAFQKLKEKLLAEGLFDAARKRPLPSLPLTVGVVTSPTGAAFVDITRTISERFAGMRIILCPARVQGQGAAEEIVAAIAVLNRRDDVDLLIVGRGGGSLEDLWPFNEEIVARAIAASRLPVISAVGHEVDFTIADLVADYRAATPTAAAQIVTEGWLRLREELPFLSRRLGQSVGQFVQTRRDHLARLATSHALGKPADRLGHWAQRLDDTSDRLARSIGQKVAADRQRLESGAGRLATLSPLGVLRRGYSITRRKGDVAALRDVASVRPGDAIETLLDSGVITSQVEKAESKEIADARPSR